MFKTIDEVEKLFTDEIERVLRENRRIELEWKDGSELDLSSNIAMKYRDSGETAEQLASEISAELLMLERVETSEAGHLNMTMNREWESIFLNLFENRGLDICEKTGGKLFLNPISASEARVASYRKAMETICALRGVMIKFGPDGEDVRLGDMEDADGLPEEILDIAGISRSNKADITLSGIKLSNDMKNPHFRWSYIDYRLESVEQILEAQGIVSTEKLDLKKSGIWRLMLQKLKLKVAIDEAIRFRDPFKYYAWIEEYLESFYSLEITRETFVPKVARALKIKL
ncbi:hypothetical protein EUAN_21670 [Andreesenia angusta]|uniref:Arginyl tRNA synthetase N-terminal domain-containing protein n=1 Tax=Andreesenia angusta TaxID=39480 RepID=A0A1S1V4M9_9FIRM|nr:hypothetical protein [Andreesenia angusta]OHW61424.1 hypothetical protein EUAN_21670 [Andreesenia angusta]